MSIEKEKEILIEILDDNVTSDEVLGFVKVHPEEVKRQWIHLEGSNSCRILLSMLNNNDDKEENFKTSLHFSIIKAKELEKSDYIGKSDPYIIITYKDKTFKSKTINNTEDPNWNYTIILEVDSFDPGTIIVEVFDEDYDTDDKIGQTSFNVNELMDCNSITNQWVKLENCKTGSIQFSSKVSKKVIKQETMVTETKMTETFVKDAQVERKYSGDPTQEFDKVHKKSCKMIVRRKDHEGNIIEEVVDDVNTSVGKEKAMMYISSGFEFDTSQDPVQELKDEDYLKPSVQKTSVSEIRIDRLSDDEDGKDDESSKTTTILTTNVIEISNDDIDLLQNLKELQVNTKTKISGLMKTIQEAKSVDTTNFVSKQIIKTVDQQGNITEETICSSDPNVSSVAVDINVEYPHVSISEHQPTRTQSADTKRHSFLQYFTSSSQPFESISSLRTHFVTSLGDSQTSEIIASENDSKEDRSSTLYMLASGEPSLEELKTHSSMSSWMETNVCGGYDEFSQTDSFSNKSDSVLNYSREASMNFPPGSNFSSQYSSTVFSSETIERKDLFPDIDLTPDEMVKSVSLNFDSNIPTSEPSSDRSILLVQGNQGIRHLLYLG